MDYPKNKTSNLIYAEGGEWYLKAAKAAWHVLTWLGAIACAWTTAIIVITDDGGQVLQYNVLTSSVGTTSLQSAYHFTDRAVIAATMITMAVGGVLAIGALATTPTGLPFANGMVGGVLSIGLVLELSLFDQAVAYGVQNTLWQWALATSCLIVMGIAQISSNALYLSHENSDYAKAM